MYLYLNLKFYLYLLYLIYNLSKDYNIYIPYISLNKANIKKVKLKLLKAKTIIKEYKYKIKPLKDIIFKALIT